MDELSDIPCYYAATMPPVPLVNTSVGAMHSGLFRRELPSNLTAWESDLVRRQWLADICTMISDSADSNHRLIHWLMRECPDNAYVSALTLVTALSCGNHDTSLVEGSMLQVVGVQFVNDLY